jgi:hypothetical protein
VVAVSAGGYAQDALDIRYPRQLDLSTCPFVSRVQVSFPQAYLIVQSMV